MNRALDRRAWLTRASLAATALLLPHELAAGRPAEILRASAPDTPDEALAALLEGNRRFAAGQITAPHRNLARLREVPPKQSPFAAVLGCADSRVPVEIVFDQGFGDLFVVRNAGNVVTSEEIASLEFGTLVLGAKVLLVLGHSHCGAVKATIGSEAVPGQISALYQHIRPAVDAGHGELGTSIRENVRLQARLLRDSSTVIAGLVRERKLRVAGGVYDLESGVVSEVTL